MPHRLADHPQDERFTPHLTRTHERFGLWRIIIISKVQEVIKIIKISGFRVNFTATQIFTDWSRLRVLPSSHQLRP